jgi:3-methyladenine DNA glycosylase AlkD
MRLVVTLLVFSCVILPYPCEALTHPTHKMPRASYNKSVLTQLPSFVKKEFEKVADAETAKAKQAYMKSSMPVYGVQKPARAVIEKKMYEFILQKKYDPNIQQPITRDLYRNCVQTLWELPHREEKYLAIDFALFFKEHIVFENLDLYERLLRDYQDIMWWDFVDPIATNLIGKVALQNQTKMEPILRKWIDDEDNMWIRRTAILAQLKHKRDTNEALLLELCRKRMGEKEFFIRKAVGWALREHSKTNPNLVLQFLNKEKSNLSGLSYREGAKVLVKKGLMKAK